MPSLDNLSELGPIGLKMADMARHARDQMASAKKKVDARQKDWYLNLAYVCDHQWVEWDELRSKVVDLPYTDEELLSLPKRETNNIIRRQLTDSIGQIVGVPPRMEALAASSQDEDIMNAKVTDRILEAMWHHLEMRSFWYNAHLFKGIYGTSFQFAYWDTNAGPVIGGKPAGDIGCMVLSPLRVYADPVAARIVPERKRPDDARFVYLVFDYDIAELAKVEKWATMRSETNEETGCDIFYGGMPEEQEIKPMPHSAVSAQEAELMIHSNRNPTEEVKYSHLHRYNRDNERNKGGRARVVVYLEWPSPLRRNGRSCVFLPDNDFWPLECRDEGLYATAQNPRGLFPITQLTDVIIPGMLLGKARMTEVRPIQDIINQLMSRYGEELKKLTPYFLFDEAAGLDEEAILEALAARVMKWDSRTGQPPQVVAPTGARASENLIENALTFCIRQAEDKMGIHNVRYYPRSAATLGELRMQKNEDLTSLENNDVQRAEETAYGPFLKACAEIAKWGYSEERTIEFIGDSDAMEIVKFRGDTIHFKDIRIVPSSSMPASKHLKKMEVMDLVVKGFIQDPDPNINRELRRMAFRILNLELPLEATTEELAANRARAENQAVIDNKQIKVHKAEPHPVHITEHERFLNSATFYNLDPKKQLSVEILLLKHIDEHGDAEFDETRATEPNALAASVAGRQLDITEPGQNPQNPMALLPPGTGAAPGTTVELPGAAKTGNLGGNLGQKT